MMSKKKQSSTGSQSPNIDAKGNVSVTFWQANTKPLLILSICVVVLSFGIVVWMASRVQPVDMNLINETKQTLQRQYEQRIGEFEARHQQSEKYYQQQISILQQTGEKDEARYDKLVDELIKARGKDIPTQTIDKALQRLQQGDTKEAEAIFKHIVETGEQEVSKTAAAFRHLGALAFLTDTDEALTAYQRAVELAPDNSDGWNYLGQLLERTGQWDRAAEAYQRILTLAESTGNQGLYVLAYNNIGLIYFKKGEWDEALEYYQMSEQIRLEVGDKADLGATYNNIGLIYDNKGEWDEALKYYQKSKQIRLEVGDKAGLGRTYNNIGSIYSKKGDWDNALAYYLKSKQIFIVVGDKPNLGATYSNIGLIYDNKGERDLALEYYQKSEQIKIEMGDKAGLGPLYNNIGLIYDKEGEQDQALEYYQKSEQIAIEVGDKAGLGRTYNNIGLFYDKKGEQDQALEYYLKSEQIATDLGDTAGLGYTALNIAVVYYKQNDRRAIDYVDRSIAIFAELGAQHELSEAKMWQKDIHHQFIEFMPPKLADEVNVFTQDALEKNFSHVKQLFQELEHIQNYSYQVTKALSQEEWEKLKEARTTLQAALNRLNQLYYTQEQKGYGLFGEKRQELNTWIRLIGGDLPPEEPSVAKSLNLYEAEFESFVLATETALKELQTILYHASSPVNYATQPGRRIVQEKQLWDANFEFSRMEIDNTVTRLPESEHGWRGFIDQETGEPVNFAEVREFKRFDQVGGGIHMGETATLASEEDLTDFILRYEAQTKRLLLLGPNGEQFIYQPVEPDVLKSLYRFALSGHNSAISIGWSGTDSSEESNNGEQPVFLHPDFVDTRVGQDLFLADKLPWNLDQEKLLNGKKNPVYEIFKDTREEADHDKKERFDTLRSFFENIEPFDDTNRLDWEERFDKPAFFDILIISLIRFDSKTEAKRYLSQNFTPAEELLKEIDSLPSDIHQARRDVVEQALVEGWHWGQVDKDILELLYALVKKDDPSVSAQKLASAVWNITRERSLSVLIDEPTTIRIRDNTIVLEGTMRCRYATRFIHIDQTGIHTKDPADPESEVRELTALTTITNNALSELETLYPPLKRVGEYARILAFLRWALEESNLAGIDFGSLALYPASDTEQFPTPDAIEIGY